MSFLDSIKDIGVSVVQSTAQNANDWFSENTGIDILGPTEGDEPTGNLTPEQISAGQSPRTPSIRPSTQNPANLARADSNVKSSFDPKIILYVVIGGAVLLMLSRKR